ncbi:MAG: hypothetical protein RLY86_3517 [Pseudomonadota bacterium]|jgi:pimeloyl-ACP methyl ester carboxylesterase
MVVLENSTNVRTSGWGMPADPSGNKGEGTAGRGFHLATLLEGLRPRTVVERAALAFLTPERHVAPPMLPEPAGGAVLAVPGRSPHLAARIWGGDTSRPAILLLHGWEGQTYDMVPLVQPLLDWGFRVVAVDAPAHGRSAGHVATLPDFARAALDVAALVGPLAGAVGHSLGGTALVLAAEMGLSLPRLALIGSPAKPLRFASKVARAYGLDADQTTAMLRIVEDVAGIPVSAIDLPAMVARMAAVGTAPAGMVIHSSDDRIVRVADALEIAGRWPGSRLRLRDGLGHRRILSDPAVGAEIAGWFAEA